MFFFVTVVRGTKVCLKLFLQYFCFVLFSQHGGISVTSRVHDATLELNAYLSAKKVIFNTENRISLTIAN